MTWQLLVQGDNMVKVQKAELGNQVWVLAGLITFGLEAYDIMVLI